VVSGGLLASLGLQAFAADTPSAVTPAAAARVTTAVAAWTPTAPVQQDVSITAGAAFRHTSAAQVRAAERARVAARAKAVAAAAAAAAAKARADAAAKLAEAKRAEAKRAEARRAAAKRAEAKRTAQRRAAARAEARRDEAARERARSKRVSRSSSRGSSAGENSSSRSIEAGRPGSSSFGAAVMAVAARYEGIDYVYGGTTPAGFDCSGFTSYVLRQVGISLPRTSSQQRGAVRPVSRSEAMPGDLVFRPGHVGIYAGNGMMWHSPQTGKSVMHSEIRNVSMFGRVG
jgi:cell wall-associated NlpC family hydrolase